MAVKKQPEKSNVNKTSEKKTQTTAKKEIKSTMTKKQPSKKVETKSFSQTVESKKAKNVKKVKNTKKDIDKKVKTENEEEMANIMLDEPMIIFSKENLKLVWNIVFWTVLSVLAFVWIVDFVKVKNEKKPVFCVKNETHFFEDGEVDVCVGLGYKVFTYDRSSLTNGVEFGSLFTKMKKK